MDSSTFSGTQASEMGQFQTFMVFTANVRYEGAKLPVATDFLGPESGCFVMAAADNLSERQSQRCCQQCPLLRSAEAQPNDRNKGASLPEWQ